jgi:hypothetical protein
MTLYKPEYDHFGGEMIPFERRFLFEHVVNAKPDVVFELGSGSGGSTRIILSALNALDKGLLYNCDPYNIAASHIEDVDTSRMKFHQTCSDEMCSNLVRSGIIPQFIFFDGPEDPNCAANDFRYLDAVLPAGVIMVMHDWEIRPRIDGNTSIKAIGMRRELDFQIKLKTWEIVEELSGVWGEYPNIDGYNSIGMVCARKIA